MSSCSLVFLCPKEEVDMDDPLYNSPEKEQGGFLIIDENPEVGELFMFRRCKYLSVFYCLCYVKDISTDMSEEQVSEERDPDLNEDEDIRTEDSREEHWSDVDDEGEDKKKIHDLRWEVYVKEKEELTKREFSVSVPHPKGGAIFWNCVKDHIIDEHEDYKDIGLRGFDYKLF